MSNYDFLQETQLGLKAQIGSKYSSPKKAGVLMSDKTDFRTNTITRDKKRIF